MDGVIQNTNDIIPDIQVINEAINSSDNMTASFKEATNKTKSSSQYEEIKEGSHIVDL